MHTPLRAVLLAAALLLTFTPAAAHADSKGKVKGPAKAPAPVVQAPAPVAPAPTAQPRATAPDPTSGSAAQSTTSQGSSTQASDTAPPGAQSGVTSVTTAPSNTTTSVASGGTLTTEDARKQIAAEAPPALPDSADLSAAQRTVPEPLPLTLRPTPQAAQPPVAPAASGGRVPAVDRAPVDGGLPSWPFVALLLLSAPAVAFTILCVRRAGPLVRILST
ncbi:MAG TPA: hypothetical protein VFX49_21860 [Chloroflexota bacterium]|nr:hypothetical protein [Chloroflexota bacterium]